MHYFSDLSVSSCRFHNTPRQNQHETFWWWCIYHNHISCVPIMLMMVFSVFVHVYLWFSCLFYDLSASLCLFRNILRKNQYVNFWWCCMKDNRILYALATLTMFLSILIYNYSWFLCLFDDWNAPLCLFCDILREY